ncbi:MAG: peptidoglycan DD-metalloendopeptidase family protein [Patescibacteria group bacterium]
MKGKISSKKHFAAYLTVVFMISGPFVFAQNLSQGTTTPASMSRDDLASQIQEKAKQLESIDKQLQSTRATLKSVKGEKATLQKELNNLTSNINQLNLSLKSDEINIQKLFLEVESLGYDLEDIGNSIQDKKNAIEKILLEFQKNEHKNNNLLLIFLRSSSLADGVLETQTLNNLQSQLVVDVGSLRSIQDEYSQKIQIASSKKNSIESHKRDSENKKLIVQDQQEERTTLLKQTKNKESVFAQQVTQLEKLQQQIANEIEALDSVLRTKIDPATLPPLISGVLLMPIEGGKNVISQGYGRTDFAQSTYKSKWHNGIDFGIPIGTPVMAAEDGVAAAVGNNDLYCPKAAYGRFIAIKNNNNLVTLYAHMSRQIVQVGQQVKRGEVIGYSGKTGWATGPHLHFTVFAAPTFYMRPTKNCGPMPQGGDINPMGYL